MDSEYEDRDMSWEAKVPMKHRKPDRDNDRLHVEAID